MQIHQLNIQYQADQDRVLARINTNAGTELRLWLTRRMTLGLLPVLRKVENEQLEKSLAAQPDEELGMTAKDPKVREMLSEFKKDRTLQQADFKTPYKEPEPGQTAEQPLLVVEVQITPLPNFSARIKFAALPADNTQRREIKMELDQKMMLGLVHLLDKAFADSRWGETSPAPATPVAPDGTPAIPARPQYLN
jgi:hypothetical protein